MRVRKVKYLIALIVILVVAVIEIITTVTYRKSNNASTNFMAVADRRQITTSNLQGYSLPIYAGATDVGVHRLTITDQGRTDVYCVDPERIPVVGGNWYTTGYTDIDFNDRIGLRIDDKGHKMEWLQWFLDHCLLENSTDQEFDREVFEYVIKRYGYWMTEGIIDISNKTDGAPDYYVSRPEDFYNALAQDDIYAINQDCIWGIVTALNSYVKGQALPRKSDYVQAVHYAYYQRSCYVNKYRELYKDLYGFDGPYTKNTANSIELISDNAELLDGGIVGPFEVKGNGGVYKIMASATVGGQSVPVKMYYGPNCNDRDEFDGVTDFYGVVYLKLDTSNLSGPIHVDLSLKHSYLTMARLWETTSPSQNNTQRLLQVARDYTTIDRDFDVSYNGKFNINLVKTGKGLQNPIQGAKFKVTVNDGNNIVYNSETTNPQGLETDAQGNIPEISGIEITGENKTYTITVEELSAPDGYIGLGRDNVRTFTARSVMVGNEYKLEPQERANIENDSDIKATVRDNEIFIEVENRVEPVIHKGVKTVENQDSGYDKNEIQNWVINSTVPEGIDKYTKYIVTDEIDFEKTNVADKRLQFINEANPGQNVVVKVKETGTVLTENVDYKLSFSANKVLTVCFIDNASNFFGGRNLTGGTTLEIVYKTQFVLRDGKILGLNQSIKNKAFLHFNGNGKEEKIKESEVPEVHTGEVKIYKYDKDTNIALAGAHFKITRSREDADNAVNALLRNDSNALNSVNFVKEYDASGNIVGDLEAVSGADGKAVFHGLEFGEDAKDKVEGSIYPSTGGYVYQYNWENVQTDYYIVETSVPEGYVLLNECVPVTIKYLRSGEEPNDVDLTGYHKIGNKKIEYKGEYNLKLYKFGESGTGNAVPMAGVKFSAKRVINGLPEETLTIADTDSNGITNIGGTVTIDKDKVEQNDVYTISEVSVPANSDYYIGIDRPITLRISKESSISDDGSEINSKAKSISMEIQGVSVNRISDTKSSVTLVKNGIQYVILAELRGNTILLIVENPSITKYGLKIHKMKEDESGIIGTEMRVFKYKENTSTNQISNFEELDEYFSNIYMMSANTQMFPVLTNSNERDVYIIKEIEPTPGYNNVFKNKYIKFSVASVNGRMTPVRDARVDLDFQIYEDNGDDDYTNDTLINYDPTDEKSIYFNLGFETSVGTGSDNTIIFKFMVINKPNEKINVKAVKEWDDNDDANNRRPQTVSVQLMADGVPKGNPVTLSDNNWSHQWNNLLKYRNGNEDEGIIEYDIVESVPAGYNDSYRTRYEGNTKIITIKNSYVSESTTVKAIKEWDDNDDANGLRPQYVALTLYADGVQNGPTVYVRPENNQWEYTWTNRRKYKGGVAANGEIEYTVKEEAVYNYTTTYSYSNTSEGRVVTIKNKYKPEVTSVMVEKIWNDNDNANGTRPEYIGVKLTVDGRQIAPMQYMSDEYGWTMVFDNLGKYKNGVESEGEINYQVEEEVPDGYEAKYTTTYVNGVKKIIIENTCQSDSTDLKAVKVWKDNNNANGKRPEYVAVTPMVDGRQVGPTQYLSDSCGWEATWTGYPKYVDGIRANGEINYELVEEVPDEYKAKYTTSYEDGVKIITIENTYETPSVELKVIKEWNDNNNANGKRPDYIVVKPMLDGRQIAQSQTLSDTYGWEASWTLGKYVGGVEANGIANYYVVEENLPEEYSDSYTTRYEDNKKIITLKNTYNVESTEVKVVKEWRDNNNANGKRPEYIALTLFADGIQNGPTVYLRPQNDDWEYTWTNRRKYRDGIEANGEIVYTVREEAIDGYSTTYSSRKTDNGTEITVINTENIGKTSVRVEKIWRDNDNANGKRPEYVGVKLLVDGRQIVPMQYLSDTYGWTTTFENLGKYVDGIEANGEINYQIQEEVPEGYEAKYTTSYENGVKKITIENTYDAGSTELKVIKEWDDFDNSNGKRPEYIIVKPMLDGRQVGPSKALSDTYGWEASWTLPKYIGGVEANGEANYTVVEENIPEEYIDSYSTRYENNMKIITIKNSYRREKTKIRAIKYWDDNNNENNKRPEIIQLTLYADGIQSGPSVYLRYQNNEFEHVWNNKLKYRDGDPSKGKIDYTVKEVAIDGYTTTYDITDDDDEREIIIKNKYNADTTSIIVEKEWDDNDNANGMRPEYVGVKVVVDGVQVTPTQYLSDRYGWSAVFDNLTKYKDGIESHGEINYEVQEEVPEKYTAKYTTTYENGVKKIIIKNTYQRESTELKVIKEWDDNNNANGKRPDYITVKPMLNGRQVGPAKALSDTYGWEATWNLPKYVNGIESNGIAEYTVEEENIPEEYLASYSTRYVGNTKIITLKNSYIKEKTTVKAIKVWDDNNNANNRRPELIELTLYADGIQRGPSVYLRYRNNEFEYTWTDLLKYKDGDKSKGEIDYSVRETAIYHYKTTYQYASTENGKEITIKNQYDTETVDLAVEKVWNDNNNANQARPEYIAVKPMKDGRPIGPTVYLSDQYGWTATWTGLTKYVDGIESNGLVNYYVEEEVPEAYKASYSSEFINGVKKITIKNTHLDDLVNIKAIKVWNDNDDANHKRPEYVGVKLMANGVQVGPTQYLSDSYGWEASWNGYRKYVNGVTTRGKIDYYVEEEVPEGYEDTYKSEMVGDTKVITIKNTYLAEETQITARKEWDDNNNANNKRPNLIQLTLYADGVQAGPSVYLRYRNDEYEYTWSHRLKYRNGDESQGKIDYTVKEAVVDGYTTTYTISDTEDGREVLIKNKYQPDTISIPVEKEWRDNNNANGKRPEYIGVRVLADGRQIGPTVYLSDTFGWSTVFENLGKYRDGIEDNGEINYTVEEDIPDGYICECKTEYINGVKKYILENTYDAGSTELKVIKEWKDNNNANGKRPSYIVVKPMLDGRQIAASKTLSDVYGWEASWTLPKYKGGVEANGLANYTVEEENVPAEYSDSYVTRYEGDTKIITIKNTYNAASTKIHVAKEWNDNNDANNKRPEYIGLTLYADGIQAGPTVYIRATDNWEYTWENRGKYKNGVEADGEIEYTVREEAVNGYTTTYSYRKTDQGTEATVTNTYTPSKTSIKVEKVWRDNNNANGKRPQYVGVKPVVDGRQVGPTQYLSDEYGWTATFDNLAKYVDGIEANGEIQYEIQEEVPEGYNAKYTTTYENGIKKIIIENTYDAGSTELKVIKEWKDNNDANAKRPRYIEVKPMLDGRQVAPAKTLSDVYGWEASWTLGKYVDGVEANGIANYYVVEENVPEEYADSYTTRYEGNTKIITITNTYNAARTKIHVAKEWNDNNNANNKRPEYIGLTLYADGVQAGPTVYIKATDDWEYTWENRGKYKNGIEANGEIEYTVREAAVDGYTTTYNRSVTAEGTEVTVTNTYTPDKTSIIVEKVWKDNNNANGKRPAYIGVKPVVNGRQVGPTQYLSDEYGWTTTFDNLAKYPGGIIENGEINYQIQEEVPEGYEAKYTTTYENGVKKIIIENTYNSESTELKVMKEWKDNNDANGKRPSYIVVKPMLDGRQIAPAQTLSDTYGWEASWTLEKYVDGIEANGIANYYVVEENIPEEYSDSYTTRYEGNTKIITITNTYNAARTKVHVTKEWNDNNNANNKRPEYIALTLYADGVQAGPTVYVRAKDNWEYTWENRGKYKNGIEANGEIEYTVREAAIDGYTTTYNRSVTDEGTEVTVINTDTPDKTSIMVEKVWKDNNNANGKRPAYIGVKPVVDGRQVGPTQYLSDEYGWTATFDNLAKYVDGIEANGEIQYEIQEEVPEEYNAKYTTTYENGVKKIIIENTYDAGSTELRVVKEWKDNNDANGKRPSYIVVKPMLDGRQIAPAQTLSDTYGWEASWILGKYVDGVEANGIANYYVVEENIPEEYSDSYTTRYEGNTKIITITNTYNAERTKIHVAKEWNDNNNTNNKRPEYIALTLYADGVQAGPTVYIRAQDNWEYTWENRGKYKNGIEANGEIEYTVREEAIDGYTTTYNRSVTDEGTEVTITNTDTPDKTSIIVEKIWKDNNNANGKRPAYIGVKPVVNGRQVGATQYLSDEYGWSATFDNLAKYPGGIIENGEIDYQIQEDVPEGYEAKYTTTYENGVKKIIIENTYNSESTELKVIKEWKDNNNANEKRPSYIVVKPMLDGRQIAPAQTLSDTYGWEAAWTLGKYVDGMEANGIANYYVVEENVPEEYADSYTTRYEGNTKIITITNTYNAARTKVHVTKEWNDNNNANNKRPEYIALTLYADGVQAGPTVYVRAKDNWEYTWENRGKYKNGIEANGEIEYTVREEAVYGYTTTYDRSVTDEGTEVTVTNTYTPDKTSIKVEKVWKDNNNANGKRPQYVGVKPVVNGRQIAATKYLSDEYGWSTTFDNLAKYVDGIEANGEINYEIVEEVPEGYEAKYTTTYENGVKKIIIENTYNSESTELKVIKEWKDNNDANGKRPSYIVVKPMLDGRQIAPAQTLSDTYGWEASWTLSKYVDGVEANGIANYYVIEENVPEEYADSYTTRYEGNTKIITITNTYNATRTKIHVAKVWRDNNNANRKRPEYIALTLYADGVQAGPTVYIKATDNWEYTWENRGKYKNGIEANGEIEYTVREAAVNGYTTTYNRSVTDEGTEVTVTNTYAPETTSIKVEKVWRDNNNANGVRPELVGVKPTVNGIPVGPTQYLSDQYGWTATFDNLAKYVDGDESKGEINYQIQEEVPEDYKAKYTTTYENGIKKIIIENTYQEEKAELKVIKEWKDNNDANGKRPAYITVKPMLDGRQVAPAQTLSDTYGWEASWSLPKYKNGLASNGLANYYVAEENVPEEYSDMYTTRYEDNTKIITITNTYNAARTKIHVAKEWNDDNNSNGKRPAYIALTLYADGVQAGPTVYVRATDNWEYTWENRGKYKNAIEANGEIEYTVREEAIEGYTTTYDKSVTDEGTEVTIINTYTPEKTSIMVEKIWKDDNNINGKRPQYIGVKPVVNGRQVAATKYLSDEYGWSATFDNLAKYVDGIEVNGEINYEIQEEVPDEYEAKYKTTYVNGVKKIIIENTYQDELVDLKVKKVWADNNNKDNRRPASIQVTPYANGEPCGDSVTLSGEANVWEYNWPDLKKYKNGQLIEYSVREEIVSDYIGTSSVERDENGNTTITIKNTYENSGRYDLSIDKLDKSNNAHLNGAKFEITAEKDGVQYSLNNSLGETLVPGTYDVNGLLNIRDISIDGVETYTLIVREVQAPDGYELLKDPIRIQVTTKINDELETEKYVLDSVRMIDGANGGLVSVNGEERAIRLSAKNESFDLALRKYIAEVNGKALLNTTNDGATYDREPRVDITSLRNGNSTTARYTHTKEPIEVCIGDVVTYTLQVYNEGSIDGYANLIKDDIPEGLEFVTYTPGDGSVNDIYRWKLVDANGNEVTDLSKAKAVVSDYLSKANEKAENANLIKAYDASTMSELDSKFVQIAFRVACPETFTGILTNQAQIADDSDSEGNDVTDRDSTPNEWKGEDDEDIEKVKVTYVDLALRKFITGITDAVSGETQAVDTRVPNVNAEKLISGATTTAEYNHPKDSVLVHTSDVVIYTIRVYNEGPASGYATIVKDDLPDGLEFLPEHEINKEYEWVLLDESDSPVENIGSAKYAVTSYLSKTRESSNRKNLIKGFDRDTMTLPDYKEVKIAFKVTEPQTSDRVIVNKAQISSQTDGKGEHKKDIDSTPNVWKGEDDEDFENVRVRYFDLALRKWVTKAIVVQDGKTVVTETGHHAEDDPEDVVKVDLKKSKLDSVVVKFEYQIRVTNEGEIAGYAKEIKDHIPDGLKFNSADNPNWKQIEDNIITTDELGGTILQPGESAEVTVVLTWINSGANLGIKVNTAEISRDYNGYGSSDIDSTPNNYVWGEDDIDDAPVMLAVKTGEQNAAYASLAVITIVVLGVGVFMVRKVNK